MGTQPSVKKTLGLTGVTVNAMALMAPGAFLWLTLQLQAASTDANGISTARDMWAGVVMALLVAFLTALAFSELAYRYPDAGSRSAYHFAQRVFMDRADSKHHRWARPVKFITGWAAHLFYWVYPGVMVAFMANLANYIAEQFGYHPTIWGQVLLACAFAAFVGFLALRGITGSTTSSIVLNAIQITMLVVFAVLAILFRLYNPSNLAPSEWYHPSVASIVLPHEWSGMLFQASIAILILVGFESTTVLGAVATNPKRDVPRGAILALLIQGLLVYLVEYFAVSVIQNDRLKVGALTGIAASAASRAPMGDLAIQIGDPLLGGNGFVVMLTIAATVALALLAATLTAMNTGVRISFAMSQDEEMPDIMGLLHAQYATPYVAVVLLTITSALIGSLGVVGGVVALTGITLASNLGTFVLYALICGLAVVAFVGNHEFNWLRHVILPIFGLIANLGMVLVICIVGTTSSGVTAQATYLALGIAAAWLALGVVYVVVMKMRRERTLVSPTHHITTEK
ncbi:MAG: APC family permease [Chloroflexi bacterium]|nr:APC family permease [Chloroflexota bacterium]